jgi:hypothetical protein
LSSYRIGDVWHADAQEDAAGTTLSRGTGDTREEAEFRVIGRAEEKLGRTKNYPV